jgi:uncharacterized protein YkwD
MFKARSLGILLLLAACGGEPSPPSEPDDERRDEEEAPAEREEEEQPEPARDAGRPDAARRPDAAPRDASLRDATPGEPDPPDATPPGDARAPMPMPMSGSVCARWKAERGSLAEGTWSGDVATCQAGDMAPEARDNALRVLNLYRSLAGLTPLTMSDAGNKLAQDCALLMRANNTITHTPPSSFKCYTAEAARTAGSSSLSSGPAVGSVDGYMIDPGNATTMGHRRWILSSWLQEVGFGSADRFSCQYQPARPRAGSGGKAWVAWPPAGQVPLQAFGGRFLGTIDQTGWTVQSDTVSLQTAQVKVTVAGEERPVMTARLGAGYGSMHALRFTPTGWTSKAGETYHVALSGTSMPIEYDVEVVDCP